MSTDTTTINTDFSEELANGLSQRPKKISSKFLYDANGSEIFQAIMNLEEYYPTDCEFEIFTNNKQRILEHFTSIPKPFKLIEFGAGDGTKTKILLEHFLAANTNFTYNPIDISEDALINLEKNLEQEFPALEVEGIHADYFSALDKLRLDNSTRKVILFLGSNIGNFSHTQAIDFLRTIREHINPGDLLMIGFDLIKNPKTILAAYNDKLGVTKEFNMNLLRRINKEFGANFDLLQWDHYPTYDPMTGTVKSFLISLKAQTVRLEKLDLDVKFEQWEPIHTEISQKYRLFDMEYFARESGFEVKEHLLDCKHYFSDSIWEAI